MAPRTSTLRPLLTALVCAIACRPDAPPVAPTTPHDVESAPIAAKPTPAVTPPKKVAPRIARALTVATSHACAVVDDGTVRCWGRPSGGVLGVSYTDPREIDPVAVPGIAHVRALAADRSRTCAVHEDATMSCWGESLVFEKDGMLVAGGSTAPQTIPGMTDVRSIALGPLDACALRIDSTARCWGDARSALRVGAKPDGPFYTLELPERTTTLAIGGGHACVLDEYGGVWCWGPNAQGQLGTGDVKPRKRPTRIKMPQRMRSIAAANAITCAVSDEGDLWCWGGTRCPPMGDCGIRDFAVKKPMRIETPEPMQAVVLSSNGGVLLDRRGAAWRLGPEVAMTTSTPAVHPTDVLGLVQIGLGLRVCGLGRDGSVECWRDDGGATKTVSIVFE